MTANTPLCSIDHDAADIVNADALVKRIIRSPAMRRDRLTVRATSPRSRKRAELGAYYIVNGRGDVTERHVDVVRLASKLGVLRPDDVQPVPLAMAIEHAEALLYAARERLQDVTGTAHERALRRDVEEAQERVNMLRAAQSRGAI
ncbi:MAG: hypothetical protein AMXMBFR59_06990 [Rhodanobacteraceae bacterium]